MLTYIFDSAYAGDIEIPAITGIGILAGIAIIAGIIAYTVYQIRKKRIAFVTQTSILIHDLDALNKRSTFHSFTPNCRYVKTLNSKPQFDKISLNDILDEWVKHHEISIKSSLQQAKDNRALYRKYCDNFDSIIKNDSSVHHDYYDTYFYFRSYENRLVEKMKLKPPLSLSVTVEKQYTSPKGRNHYEIDRQYDQADIESSLYRIQLAYEKQNEKQRERAKMTDKLRYEIMRRDNFKCCICGATANDGAKLHVDHIKPVSKGGKTEVSNLRTLCDRCNLGKGAKYDPYGKN